VRLEASTKPHVHQKFEIFWTNIASTMGCPNSKNRPKKVLRPLGIKQPMENWLQNQVFTCIDISLIPNDPRDMCFQNEPKLPRS
jgi:hypothetical protein